VVQQPLQLPCHRHAAAWQTHQWESRVAPAANNSRQQASTKAESHSSKGVTASGHAMASDWLLLVLLFT